MFKHPWLSRSLYSPEPYMNLFTLHQFNNNRHWRLGNVPFHLQPVPQSAPSAAAPVTSVSIWQPTVLRWKFHSRGLWFHTLRSALSAVWSSVRLCVCGSIHFCQCFGFALAATSSGELSELWLVWLSKAGDAACTPIYSCDTEVSQVLCFESSGTR